MALIIAFSLLYLLRNVIAPFIIGILLAYLLLPLISWVEQRLPHKGRWLQTKRVSIIVLIYVIVVATVAGFSYYLFIDVIKAFASLVNYAPNFIARGIYTIQTWLAGIRELFPPEIRVEVDKAFLEAGQTFGDFLRSAFTRGISTIQSSVNLIFGFVALPIFLFYLLKDWEKIGKSMQTSLPPWFSKHARAIMSIIEGVFGRYVRAQILLGLIVGYLCFVGLLVLRIPFAPALAVLAAVTEVIPIVGPWIAGAAAVIVTLAMVPEKTIWVIVLYFVVQLAENNLLVPRIQGTYLKIHPAVVLILLVLGAFIAGFWGILVIVPLAATIIEIYKYIRANILVHEEPRPQIETKEQQ